MPERPGQSYSRTPSTLAKSGQYLLPEPCQDSTRMIIWIFLISHLGPAQQRAMSRGRRNPIGSRRSTYHQYRPCGQCSADAFPTAGDDTGWNSSVLSGSYLINEPQQGRPSCGGAGADPEPEPR